MILLKNPIAKFDLIGGGSPASDECHSRLPRL
jgi:hypothetical protein